MTLHIPKSQLLRLGTEEELSARVEAFRQAKLAHQKTTDVPAPVDHPLVEACLARVSRGDDPDDFVADYQVIDDAPPPPDLATRKQQLMGQIAEAENAALAKIAPYGKRRLFAMRAADIATSDIKRMNDASIKRNAIQLKAPQDRTAAETEFLTASNDLATLVAAGRTAEDAQFLADQAARQAQSEQVNRHAAELTAEVEDLKEATIDQWQMKPFPA